MALYRKKPGVIEAHQWNGEITELPDWIIDQTNSRHVGFQMEALLIPTLEGVMRADHNDWIIKGVNGEIYPCKPDIFEKTYEPADTPKAVVDAMVDAIATGQGAMLITHIDDVIDRGAPLSRNAQWAADNLAPAPTPDQIYDCQNNVEPPRTVAERIVDQIDMISGSLGRGELIDKIAHALEDAMMAGEGRATARLTAPWAAGGDPVILCARITQLEQQLEAEGEHTAAANANIDRLNTEIERITRRQQGVLSERALRIDTDEISVKKSVGLVLHILHDSIPRTSMREAERTLHEAFERGGVELTSKMMRKEYQEWKSNSIDALGQ